MKFDLGRPGPLGMDARIRNGVLYLGGSNHWLEWAHHILPFAGRRERRWADQVLRIIVDPDTPTVHTIAGHSVGGTVACIVRWMHGEGLRLITYGAKRPPRGSYPGRHYCIKGDPVPYLPPWRPKLPLIVLDYGDLSWREAHGPANYYEQMREDGVR